MFFYGAGIAAGQTQHDASLPHKSFYTAKYVATDATLEGTLQDPLGMNWASCSRLCTHPIATLSFFAAKHF